MRSFYLILTLGKLSFISLISRHMWGLILSAFGRLDVQSIANILIEQMETLEFL